MVTDGTWNESKLDSDEWDLAAKLTLAEPLDALAGTRYLVVADRFVTKMDGASYHTALSGGMFFLGSGDADQDAINKAKFRVLTKITNSLESMITVPVPPPPPSTSSPEGGEGGEDDEANPLWLSDAPMPLMPDPSPKKNKKRRRSIEDASTVHPVGEVGELVRPAALKKARRRKKSPPASSSSPGDSVSPTAGIMYVPNAIPEEQGVALFQQMARDVPWVPKMWRGKALPRLVWHYAEGVSPLLDVLLCSLKSAFGIERIKGAFCNLYRTGEDYTPYHKDEYGADVMSISLGATRRFIFKEPKKGGRKLTYNLNHGDILMFDEPVNERYQHSVPRMPSVKVARINITVFAVRASTAATTHHHQPSQSSLSDYFSTAPSSASASSSASSSTAAVAMEVAPPPTSQGAPPPFPPPPAYDPTTHPAHEAL